MEVNLHIRDKVKFGAAHKLIVREVAKWRKPGRLMLLIGASIALVHAASASSFGPRLLAVEKDGHTAFFLPETHVGTPTQYDRYFETTIRKAFAASSVFLSESAHEPLFERAHYQKKCDDEGVDEVQLDPAINANLERHMRRVPEVLQRAFPDPRTLARPLRVEMLLFGTSEGNVNIEPGTDQQKAMSPARATKFNAQSGQLMFEMPHQAQSVDDTESMFSAYCALVPAERAALIRSLIKMSTAPPDAMARLPLARFLARYVNETDAVYRAALVDMKSAVAQRRPVEKAVAMSTPLWAHLFHGDSHDDILAIDRYAIVQRNRGWIAQLPATLARERLPFFAIGAAHFPDGPNGPGLVTMLREAGYVVTLVDGERTLRQVLAKVPAPPKKPDYASLPIVATPMHGSCKTVDNLMYGCQWEGPAISFLVTGALNSSWPESGFVCYERDTLYGPLRTCISIDHVAGPWRDADLAGATATFSLTNK